MSTEAKKEAARRFYAKHRKKVLAYHKTVYGRLMNQRRMARRRFRKAKTERQRERASKRISEATAEIERFKANRIAAKKP